MIRSKIFYTRYAHTHQLLLWLTLDLPNLCISVYIYLAYPRVAPARTIPSCSSCAYIMCCEPVMPTLCVLCRYYESKTLAFLPVLGNMLTVMVSVAIV